MSVILSVKNSIYLNKNIRMFFLDKPNGGKPSFILFKVCLKGGARFVYSTGEKIELDHWSQEANRPKKMRGELGIELKYISSRLEQIENAYTDIIRNSRLSAIPISKDYLKTEMDKKIKGIGTSALQKTDLISLIKAHISARKNDPTFGRSTKSRYNKLSALIEGFDEKNKQKSSVHTINDEWYFNFLDYMYTEKKYLDNTAGSYISKLVSVINWAKRRKFISRDTAEDAIYYLKVIERDADTISMTFEEIVRIEALPLKAGSILELVRDLFLIGCYSGQRFSDYSVFEKPEYRNGFIHKVTEKMENISYIPVDANPPLKRLLEKYNWNVPLITNQKFNENIKEIGRLAGIKDLVKVTKFRGKEKIEEIHPKYVLMSSHTARRSFITLASQSAMDDRSTMNISGITNIETLIKYNKVSEQGIREQMSRFLEGLKKATPKKKGGLGT